MMENENLSTPEKFDFPFEPYDIQHDFMKHLYEVIEHKKLGIFESPTGTGKSLSIICGAIRWLKDHNTYIRSSLSNKIEDLESQKQQITSDSTDWLSTQSKGIEINQKINELKIAQNRISQYDKKIENIKIKKQKNTKFRIPKADVNPINVPVEEKNVEDEDILLEESHLEDENSDNEEDEELKYRSTKIFICSRTHSQLSQFIGEILKSPFSNDIRVASLASRQTYCINPNVNQLKNNSLINERCLDLQKQIKKQIDPSDSKTIKKRKSLNCKCPYYKQTAIEELKDVALMEVHDIEDLMTNGRELKGCPYYASRLAAEDAEIVLIPYNTILHKATREANGINLKDNVLIVDEAHNLLEAMAQMHNSELSYNQIEQSLLQLKCYKQRFNTRFSAPNLLSINQLIFVVTKLQQLLGNSCRCINSFYNATFLEKKCQSNKTDTFTTENFVLTAQIDNYNMFRLLKFCKDSQIAQKVRSYAIKYPSDKEASNEKPPKKGIKDFLSSIENKKQLQVEGSAEIKQPSPVLGNPLLSVISFLESLTYSYVDGRIFVHNNSDKSKTKLQFLLLNPTQNFKDIVKEARSVVVCGGTMKPNSEFKDRLFIGSGADPGRIVEFSCDHIIPPENILPIILTEGAKKEKLLFTYEQRMLLGDSLKCVIQEACKKIQGGIVVFFPSYSYENWVWEQIKNINLGRPVFREPQSSGAVDTVLKKYSDAIMKFSSGALLLSVVGGKLSEGLNFSDDLGRCIIVVGLPYANVMAADLKEKMTYLDKTEGAGAGKTFYECLCMKAVNQSIGRAVRHKNDYATILLVDERYNRTSTKNSLPNWIKKSLKVCNFEGAFVNIQKFFEAKRRVM